MKHPRQVWPRGANAQKQDPSGCWPAMTDHGGDPPGVAFTYAPGRLGQHAENILSGFNGILQVGGYAGYNRLLKQPAQDVALAYYWAHTRRKLHDVTQSYTAPIA